MINNSETVNRKVSESESSDLEHDLYFEPIVTLPEIEISTNEENEEELIKLRAKLYRFDTTDPDTPEWKERGTGEVKLLQHKQNKSVRVVMRRDKTYKICANHFVTPWMELKPSAGSNRAWIWTVAADFADELPKSECLAIRFQNAEIANQWKDKFEEAKHSLKTECDLYKDDYKKRESSDESSSDEEEENEKVDQEKSETEAQNTKVDNKDTSDQKLIDKLSDLNVSK